MVRRPKMSLSLAEMIRKPGCMSAYPFDSPSLLATVEHTSVCQQVSIDYPTASLQSSKFARDPDQGRAHDCGVQ